MDRLRGRRTFVFIGGEMPMKFVADCGVEIVTRFGTP
jgi:hypothetical protein